MMNGPRVPDSFNIQNHSKTHPFEGKIIKIKNRYTQEILPFNTINFSYKNHMYSSKKEQPIWCLEIDGEHISKHKPYNITYNCPTCSQSVEVGITQFLRKIQRIENSRCRYCVNKDEQKCFNHSELLKNSPCVCYWKKEKEEVKKYTVLEKRDIYETSFNEEFDSEEQASYFSFHLTKEEFAHIKKHIVSLNNGRITQEEFNTFEYFPIWKCSNQMKFSCMLYNPTTETLEKPQQINCKCETCDNIFRIKSLHSLKNKFKVMCKECSLCRNTFKKRCMMNIQNEKVIVQSKLEIKFLKWCNENDILVKNGPRLAYEWNNTSHTYHVDFEIPKLKWIIETKDMHVWHKQQMENGKWNEKYKSATNQITKGIYNRYLIIFPKNWIRLTKMILQNIKREDIV